MEESERCKNYALKLLKYRNRSEEEISKKLKEKKFSDIIVTDFVRWLKEKKYLDDQQFVREWIESRKRKGYSEKLIRWELKRKGIVGQNIESEISGQEQILSDKEVAKKLVEKKMKQCKNLEPLKFKQKVQSLLLRRGFPWEIIEEILKKNDYTD